MSNFFLYSFIFISLFILQIIFDILTNQEISKISNCKGVNGKNLIQNLNKSRYLSMAYVIITLSVFIFYSLLIFGDSLQSIIKLFLLILGIIGAILLVIIMIYNNYLSIKSRNYMLKYCFKDNKKLINNLLIATIIRSLLIFVWIFIVLNSLFDF